jgi:hypothetical protein
MRTVRTLVIFVAATVVPLAAQADKTKKTARQAATTGADAVVDSGRLVGRTTKAYFKGGTDAAKKTAKKNAKTTSEDAKANGRATREAAHEKD